MPLRWTSPYFRIFMAFLLGVIAQDVAFGQTGSPGCTDVWACNYLVGATEDDGSCEYVSCIGCTNANACNFDPEAIYNAGCEFLSCVGCMSVFACNFDPEALVPDYDACDFESCVGCTDFTACTFDPEATLTDLNLCVYPEPDFDCDGNQIGCGGCEPIFTSAFPLVEIGCTQDFPMQPGAAPVAVNGCTGDTLSVSTFVVDATDAYVINVGTTANGIGPDGAIRIFGLTALGLSNSDFFEESYPLIVSRYANGIAVINGQVQNTQNPNLKWNVHLVLEDATPAEEWLAESPYHGFVSAYGCSIDTASTVTYRLAADHSYLIGAGGFSGSYLQLSHMPVSEFKRFQLGPSGNSVNCEFGLGGWFAWSGQVLGQPVSGMSGDLVIDLEPDVVIEVPCSAQMVVHFHHALNPNCGLFTETVQLFALTDTTPPTWSGCESEVALCFDNAGGGVVLPSPCLLTFEDECGTLVTGTYTETVLIGDPVNDPNAPFEIERLYTASDCSGNASSFSQLLVFDGTACPQAPTLPAPVALVSTRSIQAPVRKEAANPSSAVLRLFPNPTNSTSKLELHLESGIPCSISIRDLSGATVAIFDDVMDTKGDGIAQLVLDATSWVPGCYLIQIQHGTQRETLRWVVTR